MSLEVQQAIYELFQTLRYGKLSHSFHFPRLFSKKSSNLHGKKMFSSSSKAYQISVNSSPSPQSQNSPVASWTVLFSVKEMHLNKIHESYNHTLQLSNRQFFRYGEAITAKDSWQRPQVFAAKAIVYCSSGVHRKRVTTEAVSIHNKSYRHRFLFVRRSPQKNYDGSRKYSWLALSRNRDAMKKLFENHSVDKVKKFNVIGDW